MQKKTLINKLIPLPVDDVRFYINDDVYYAKNVFRVGTNALVELKLLKDCPICKGIGKQFICDPNDAMVAGNIDCTECCS